VLVGADHGGLLLQVKSVLVAAEHAQGRLARSHAVEGDEAFAAGVAGELVVNGSKVRRVPHVHCKSGFVGGLVVNV